MKFVDQVRIEVKAGDGGNGAIAFRREKYVPFGGPAGGDGARGGDVVFEGDEGRTSLLDLAAGPKLRARNGEHGRGKDQYGRAGDDLVVRVPVGTEVYDVETDQKLCDITGHGERVVVAQGGKGGRGNIHFATPFDRAPRRAEPGTPGEERRLRLELKVLADVGLLGFPNVGKSTLVAAMSRARPKIADYPFTTLRPHLGVVKIGGRSSSASFVLADIPGLIPGASDGHGLGTRFLKHVERCRALLHVVAPPTDPLREEGREPLADFRTITAELARFAPELAARPTIVVMSKADLPETREAWVAEQKRFAKAGIRLRLVSAATGEGLPELARELYHLVRGRAPELDDAEATSAAVSSDTDVAEAPVPAPRAPRAARTAKPTPAKKGSRSKNVAKKTANTTAKKSAKKPAKKPAKKALKKAAGRPATRATKKAAKPARASKKTAAKKAAKKAAAKPTRKGGAKKPARRR